jgi:hypothetical protein
MHAPTINKWKKKKKEKKKTLHMLTHEAIWGCGFTSLVVCINDKFHDIWEKNVTIRTEISTNIRPLGFGDIRECVILWRLILQSWRCIWCHMAFIMVPRHSTHSWPPPHFRNLGPLHTQDWEHVTITFHALSLVERRSRFKFTSHCARGTNRICEWKMDVKSTWIPTWDQMDRFSY